MLKIPSLRPTLFALLTAGLCFSGLPAQAQNQAQTEGVAKGPLPLAVVAADWELANVVISPDGKHIAGIAAVKGQNPVVRIWKTDEMDKVPVQFGSRSMRFLAVSFVKNDRLLIFANQPVALGANSDWFAKAAVTDLEGKNFMEIEGEFSGFDLLSRLPADPDNILVQAQTETGGEALKYNVRTGRSTRVARLGDNNESFNMMPEAPTGAIVGITDANGQIRTKTELQPKDGTWFSRVFWRPAKGDWVEMTGLTRDIKKRFQVDVLGMSSDERYLYVATNKNTNFSVLARYNIAEQKLEDPLFANTEYDAASIVFWSKDEADDAVIGTDKIAGFCYLGPSRECIYSDPDLSRIQALLERAFPGQLVSLRGLRNNGSRILVRTTAPNSPDAFYLLKDQRQLVRIGSILEGWDSRNLGGAQWVTYPARDGLMIPGILYTPPGYQKERDGPLPLVVMPHGGPWARDDMDYDSGHWSQMFATRGFAVLLPNYRGSTDLGMTLWKAGDKEWGAKMQDDKDDGARWLVEQGYADPNRMMMYGYSYGGFAAASAAARSSDASKGLWQCAISGSPAIDLERISNEWGANRVARINQGVTVAGRDPMKDLDKVSIPWLIFHGSYDRQADTIHSRTAAARMRQVNPKANFRYVEIPGMAHQIVEMTPEHKLQFTTLIFDWMSNNCGNISAKFKEPGLATPPSRRAAR